MNRLLKKIKVKTETTFSIFLVVKGYLDIGRALNEGMQRADRVINFKVRTALACSQGVEKPVKRTSLKIQKRGKYRRDGRG